MASAKYVPSEVEKKWQDYWAREKTFQTSNPGEPGFDAYRRLFPDDASPELELPRQAKACTPAACTPPIKPQASAGKLAGRSLWVLAFRFRPMCQ